MWMLFRSIATSLAGWVAMVSLAAAFLWSMYEVFNLPSEFDSSLRAAQGGAFNESPLQRVTDAMHVTRCPSLLGLQVACTITAFAIRCFIFFVFLASIRGMLHLSPWSYMLPIL